MFLEIDGRWSSERMLASRRKFWLFRSRYLGEDGVLDRERFTAKLIDLRRAADKDPEKIREYAETIQILSFFETLGLLVQRRYLDLEDVSLLIGTSLHTTVRDLLPFMRWLRKTYRNDRLYANSERLATDLKRLADDRA